MATANKRPKAVFSNVRSKKIGDFILRIRTILLNILNNSAIFTAPTPTVPSVTTSVNNLETAEILASTRVAGSVSARDLKYDVVLKAVHGLLNYVQNLADNAPDEATAISIITASGFDLKNAGIRVKAPIAVKNGAVSGSVLISAKSAGARTSYNWRYSVDNVTWIELPTTIQAKTTVSGLTPATIVHFQCRSITKTGAGNWSQTMIIVVQ